MNPSLHGGDIGRISRGANLRIVDPYLHYRFPTGLNDGNLSRGDQLLDADIEPRSEGLESLRFRDPQTGIIRVLALNDLFPTAEELFQINDAEQNWCANTSRARCQLFRNNPAQLNFVGQTALATSYGLLQVLYETAVADMRWPGIGTGAQNQSYCSTQRTFGTSAGRFPWAQGMLEENTGRRTRS